MHGVQIRIYDHFNSVLKTMKTRTYLSLSIFALASLLTLSSPTAYGREPLQGQTTSPKLSDGETQALNAIDANPDPMAKLAGVAEFIKKFPTSSARIQLAERIAAEIAKTKDDAQAIALGEKARTIFTAEPELAIINKTLLDAYASANRPDDVFKLANEMMTRDPADIHVLIQMTFTGTAEVKRKNAKFAPQALQSGIKAIELIETDKKPANISEAAWAVNKSMLPQLYQQTAILNLVGGNAAEAKARLIKSTTLGPTDPSSFALLGLVINDEYLNLATSYKAMPEGTAKQEALKKLEALLDSIIDIYAHAAALATGRPEYEGLLQQVQGDLTSYYKFRHNQSVEGLQQLIDKYKVTAKP